MTNPQTIEPTTTTCSMHMIDIANTVNHVTPTQNKEVSYTHQQRRNAYRKLVQASTGPVACVINWEKNRNGKVCRLLSHITIHPTEEQLAFLKTV